MEEDGGRKERMIRSIRWRNLGRVEFSLKEGGKGGTCFFSPLLFPHSLVFKLRFSTNDYHPMSHGFVTSSFFLSFFRLGFYRDRDNKVLVSSSASSSFIVRDLKTRTCICACLCKRGN